MTTILCVEDDLSLQALLQYGLGRAGLSVMAAHTGREALGLLKSRPIDLVLLDVKLPDMSGTAVLSELCAGSRVPVILLTGSAEHLDLSSIAAYGIAGHIAKPFSTELLLRRISTVLNIPLRSD